MLSPATDGEAGGQREGAEELRPVGVPRFATVTLRTRGRRPKLPDEAASMAATLNVHCSHSGKRAPVAILWESMRTRRRQSRSSRSS